MKLEISHKSRYIYNNKVFFEPHYFRLKPKITAHSNLLEYNIIIEPESDGFSEQIDIENNYIRLCWFNEMHDNMTISARSVIEIEEYNPFNFLIHPAEYFNLPYKYDKPTSDLLQSSLKTRPITRPMQEFQDNILKRSGNLTINFLTDLTKQIHSDFTLENREYGIPFDPKDTFQLKRGSCRDIAWMQIHLLRNLGIASRFVSGYFYLNSDAPEFELHAWIEVFLPGAGWIGFDPSHGIVTSYFHIPLASSSYYENTMPVSGTIRGDATSKLEYNLDIKIL